MNRADCDSKSNFIVKAILLFSLATIAFYQLTEHGAHLLAYSSYILFFGFILLHIFMCRGHSKHGGHEGQEGQRGYGGCCGEYNHAEHKHWEADKGIEKKKGLKKALKGTKV
jgi:hypothetical protein